MLFKIDSEENEKRNANSILIFGFTMKFYITYLPVFETPLALHLQLWRHRMTKIAIIFTYFEPFFGFASTFLYNRDSV